MARSSTGLVPQALDLRTGPPDRRVGRGGRSRRAGGAFRRRRSDNQEERTRITERHVAEAIEEIPRPSVSLGRVLALPANEQLVLRELIDLDASDRTSSPRRRNRSAPTRPSTSPRGRSSGSSTRLGRPGSSNASSRRQKRQGTPAEPDRAAVFADRLPSIVRPPAVVAVPAGHTASDRGPGDPGSTGESGPAGERTSAPRLPAVSPPTCRR